MSYPSPFLSNKYFCAILQDYENFQDRKSKYKFQSSEISGLAGIAVENIVHASKEQNKQKPGKFVTLLRIVLTLGNDSYKVFRQHKWNSFPVDTKLLLAVVEKMSEVNVKNLPH